MKELKGAVPEEGHLAVITGPGQGMAIRKGQPMLIVDDPKNVSRVVPVLLLSVTRDKIVFRCACGNRECTRVMEYHLTAKGTHPYMSHAGG